ncbi:MAG: glycosyltransferase family 2 protein [Chloroflexi bacterium]|nr:glycosyltransferase family 2 protein [Chloroflexota bacterium]
MSVVIVSYNRRQLLEECLRGLDAQTWKDFEIIVVDNGSDDGSAEHIRRYFQKVRLIPLERNAGFCEANNRGIKTACGELILLLNNDAVPDGQWLGELVRAAEEHPDAGFFASRVIFYDSKGVMDSAGDGLAFTGTAFRRGHYQPDSGYREARFVFGASGSAAGYRRAVLKEIGVFDQDLFAVYEDVDLSFRAQLAGFKCLYVPSAIVRHRGSRTVGKYSEFYVYQTQRNVEIFFLKDMPTLMLLLLLPSHLFYNLAGLLYFTLVKRRGRAFLKAKIDALRQLGSTLRKRSQIQAGRRVSILYLFSLMEHGWLRRTAREKLVYQ